MVLHLYKMIYTFEDEPRTRRNKILLIIHNNFFDFKFEYQEYFLLGKPQYITGPRMFPSSLLLSVGLPVPANIPSSNVLLKSGDVYSSFQELSESSIRISTTALSAQKC